MYEIYHKSSYGLEGIANNSVDAIITDPPYGIKLEKWDELPHPIIWSDCFRVLKPGGYLLCFSSIVFQHVFTKNLIDAGFDFKDVILWVYLNGRVPPINIDKKIDDHLNIEREVVGEYNYKQGVPNSKKSDTYTHTKKSVKTKASEASQAWSGFGTGLKTAYEPIIMVQKPIEQGLSLAENILKYNTGAINLEKTRIPYDEGEKKVGHNPHPIGRVMPNIIQTENFGNYEKFFFVGKVRDGKKTQNNHPTVKPTLLMDQLVNLVSIEGQTILDPFMGSGSTGVSSINNQRNFIGFEEIEDYFKISQRRLLAKE